jgi:hypothetical protein
LDYNQISQLHTKIVATYSEDGQWMWNGSEWIPAPPSIPGPVGPPMQKPAEVEKFDVNAALAMGGPSGPPSPLSKEPEIANDDSTNIVALGVSKKSLFKEHSFRLGIVLFCVGVLLTYLGNIALQHDYRDEDLLLRGMLSCLIGLIVVGYSALFVRNREWYCGACKEKIEMQALIQHSQFDVKSTSMSTKKITSSSPQLGMGMVGGKSGSFVSIGRSTSHVPTVLGRVLASHECRATGCSGICQWQFDTEVKVWTDASTGEVSYDITGVIQLPQ